MTVKETLIAFHTDKIIPDEFLASIEANRDLRVELIDYFRLNKDREFVSHLLDKMVDLRKQKDKEISGDSIMLACYLVGLHKHVEDCLTIWRAKTTDFDTFCYVDIQLVPFAGLEKTIDYLKSLKDKEAQDALIYILDCKKSWDPMNLIVTTPKIRCPGMFDLRTEPYQESVERLPAKGQQVIAYQDENSIVVYQAYKKSIAEFSVSTQTLGGADFSYNRMSWIKPNFLWMMFRCGWAEKTDQEAVLAITISKAFFLEILGSSIASSFSPDSYCSHDEWRNELNLKQVRLQWDPDHDPFGNKLSRRAIQLGLKDDVLKKFDTSEIENIKDITTFVRQQKRLLDNGELNALRVPYETVFEITDVNLIKSVGIKAD